MVATTSDSVQRVMKGNRGKNTQPELHFRTLVHRAGLRYAIDSRPEADLNRRADLVFRSAKVAVFIHGCFWHGCFRHYVPPKSNKKFWSAKVERNKARDKETVKILRNRGWKVIVYWEHTDPATCYESLVKLVQARRSNFS